ncbi:nuclease A inhibitor family protein [Stigmatella hybrida]|uniref:nuclease A inhibitor family protein n=1 Tax=Stigmatella hybrida TaxID=394097 RepID=UPI001CDB294F|nr:nuclease A inhibitor family protein [Stigmatella hybrida]
MPTIATSDVHAALNRAAEQLLGAAGPDGIVSRKDIRARLLSLEGTERALVDTLYRFIDRRDSARSARVTKADIGAALKFIQTDLVDRFDLDNNGLSEDEIARMSELGKLAVTLARSLKAATAPTGEALAKKIGELSKGLFFDGYYGTEGGVPIQPFHAAAKLSQLTPDVLRSTLKLTNRPEHEVARFESADSCLQALINAHYDMPEQEQAEELVRFMKAHLRGIHAALLGRDNPELGAEHPLYIVGTDSAGNLVGLKTGVIWT